MNLFKKLSAKFLFTSLFLIILGTLALSNNAGAATAITGVSISGTPRVGQSLTASISPSAATANYQWIEYRTGGWGDIYQATSSTYTISGDMLGRTLSVEVTGTGNYTGLKESSKTGTVYTTMTGVSISGTAKVGQTLTASVSPSIASPYVTYRWEKLDCLDLSNGQDDCVDTWVSIGATSSTYTPSSGDAGFSIRVVATSSGPVTATSVTSSSVMITSLATLPTVITGSIAGINSSSATSTGNVTSNGGATVTQSGLVWSTASNPTTSNSKTTDGWAIGGPWTSSMSGLSSSTTYHARAYATNSVGTSYGSDVSFNTTAANSIATISSPTSSNVTSSGAILGANVTSLGNPASISARGICYRAYGTASRTDGVSTCVAASGTSTGIFTVTLSGLPSSTSYNFVGYADHQQGPAMTSQGTFNTTAANSIATISSPTSSNVTSSGAILGANVTSLGNPASISARGVCYRAYGTASRTDGVSTCVAASGTSTGSFTVTLSGLSPSSAYNFVGYADHQQGPAMTSQGTFNTGATAPKAPTVSTNSVTGITQNTAVSGGNVTSNGGAIVSVSGIAWSTLSSPTTSSSKTTDGWASGSWTDSNITGLTPDTTYHVRAYATNSVGTSYGQDVSFKTGKANAGTPTSDTNPRISYWQGKVNQHVNISTGMWESDADGVSGADIAISQLSYCKKFYPNTTSTIDYQTETIDTWRDKGNVGAYTSTRMSTICVSGTSTGDTNPRISYWQGKVNQHVNISTGMWESDSDGVSGADTSMTKTQYCQKFYPNTTSTIDYQNETINSWHDKGNVDTYTSTRMSTICVSGTSTSDSTPRISYWQGKVNQHVNVNTNMWESDADGVSGADIAMTKTQYCQKFYPNTTSTIDYQNETINSWHDKGNVDTYTSTRMSTICVSGTITQDPTPRISYWQGKVNQHVNLSRGIWESDADGVSGADIAMTKTQYCQKFYPSTTNVADYKIETINSWHDKGNVSNYASARMSTECKVGGPAVPSCFDGIKNQDETGVDTGGVCGSVPPSPTCFDGIRNQDETGIDTGGVCGSGQPTPTCSDGIRNQDETGKDTGGVCAAGVLTISPSSCQIAKDASTCTSTGATWNTSKTTSPAFIDNNVGTTLSTSSSNTTALRVWVAFPQTVFKLKDGIKELGSATVTASCVNGTSWDATSSTCKSGGPAASCSDGIRNQDETGVDTGGACATGTLTVSPSSCQIAKDASTCTSTGAIWSTTKTTSPALVDNNTGTTLSTLANKPTALQVWVAFPQTVFKIKDGIKELGSATVTASCVNGTSWDVTSNTCISGSVIPPGPGPSYGGWSSWSGKTCGTTGFETHYCNNPASFDGCISDIDGSIKYSESRAFGFEACSGNCPVVDQNYCVINDLCPPAGNGNGNGNGNTNTIECPSIQKPIYREGVLYRCVDKNPDITRLEC